MKIALYLSAREYGMVRYTYEATLEKEDDGKYYVSFPEFDESTTGSDINDAVNMAGELLELTIAAYLDDGITLPDPIFRGSCDGLLRIGISVSVTDEMRKRMRCVTQTEASKMLGLSTGRIAHMLNAGVLQAVPYGNERLVTLASINERLAHPRGAGRPSKKVTV